MSKKFTSKRILMLTLAFIMMFSSISMATSSIEGRNIIRIKVDKKDPVTLLIESGSRIIAIDEQIPDENGFVEFRVNIPNEISVSEIKIRNGADLLDSSKFEIKKIKDDDTKPVDPIDPVRPEEKTVDLSIDGYNGRILNLRDVKVKSTDSVLDVTLRSLDENGISYIVRKGYVASIDNQAEFDKGEGSGWMYSVDGSFPNKGADYLRAEDYNRIEWKYTYNLGKDIGAGEKWLRVDDKEDILGIDEILKSLESKNISEKEILKQLKQLFREISKIKDSETLNYGEKIYNALYKIQNKFNSNEVSKEIANISLVMTEKVNKNGSDRQRSSDLFSKNLGLINLSLNNVNSKSEKEKIAKNIIEITKGLSNGNINHNRVSINKIFVNFGDIRDIKLNIELLKEFKKQKIAILCIENSDLSIELKTKDLDGAILLKLSKDIVSIREGGREVEITPPIKIKIKTTNRNSLIKVDGKLVSGLNDGKETVAYSNKLGAIGLENRKIVNFNDLEKHGWAKEAIDILAGNHVIAGREKTTFDPKASITRAEFAALLSRMLNLETSKDALIFKDIDTNAWYLDSVKALYEKNYISGKTNELFDPNEKITREEMSRILGEVLKDYGYIEADLKELNNFADSNEISTWAKDGAAIMVKNGALKGSNGNFNPKNNATRAETANLLYEAYKLILED